MATRNPDPRLQALDDRALIAAVLFGEARGEPIEGQAGVLNVFRNRLDNGRWGPTYHRVLLGWAQFSCVWPTLSSPRAFEALVQFGQAVQAGVGFKLLSERQIIALTDALLSGSLVDNTKGATHYYALTPQLIQEPPRWSKAPAIQTGMLGNQVFFKGVA